MLNRLSMSQKMMVSLLPAVIIITFGILLFTHQAVKQSVSSEARTTAIRLIKADGEQLASQLTTRTHKLAMLSTVVSRLDAVPSYQHDMYISNQLQQFLTDNPELLAAWTRWEASADNSFSFYWYRTTAGHIQESLPDNFQETIGNAAYEQARQTGKILILDPFTQTLDGEPVITVRVVVPVMDEERFLGVLGLDIRADYFQQQVAQLNNDNQVSALFGSAGTIIAHPDEGRLGRLMQDTEHEIMQERIVDAARAVQAGQPYTAEFFVDAMQANAMVSYVPVELDEFGVSWSLARIIPMRVILEEVNAITRKVLMIGAVGLVLLILLITLLARGIARPLGEAAGAMEDLARGEGDLTRRLPVRGQDEIARLGNGFNTFAARVQSLISDLAQHSQTLASTATQLQQTSQQAAQGADQQRMEIQQIAAAMDEMTASVREVANHAQQTSLVTRSGREQTEQGAALIQEVSQTIGGQAQEVRQTALKLAELASAGEEIELVITTIQSVAEQTNLLALNAAIEAARAGEHGRGFAVVADEVRALASRTHSSTEEIRTTVQRLQNMIQEAVAAMDASQQLSEFSVEKADAGLDTLRDIGQQVVHIEEMNLLVASTTEQQSATALQLANNTSRIEQLADEAAQGANQTAEGSRSIEQLARQLNSIIERFRF